jgi:hypothetical protein
MDGLRPLARLARRSATACVLLALLCTSSAFGEPADERATLAQELFDQGRTLMEQKDYERACKKFEDSARLERAGGTVLNLALCYELQGRPATAWAQFHDALTLARRDGRLDRQRFAEEHIATLLRQMPRVRIVVPPGSRVPGLVVRRNSVSLAESAWGEALGVDPGPLLVEASAPGTRPFRMTLRVPPGSSLKTIVVPQLTRDVPPARRVDPAQSSAGNTQRWLALGAGALGLAAIGVGSFFGIRAIDRQNTAEDLCPNVNRCNPRAFAVSEEAEADGRLATYLIGGGAVALGAGAVLFVTAPRGRETPASVTFAGGF